MKLRVPQEVLDAHGETRKLLYHITDMLSLYPGERDVLVYLPGKKAMRCNSGNRITLTPELLGRLEKFLGRENIKY